MTLMKVPTTVLEPSKSTVTMNGIRYDEHSYEKIRRNIGYLPREIQLYPDLIVRECLEYISELPGAERTVCRRWGDAYLERTSLKNHQKRICQLSDGMKRHVGFV